MKIGKPKNTKKIGYDRGEIVAGSGPYFGG
jgi:hypothetical protein